MCLNQFRILEKSYKMHKYAFLISNNGEDLCYRNLKKKETLDIVFPVVSSP